MNRLMRHVISAVVLVVGVVLLMAIFRGGFHLATGSSASGMTEFGLEVSGIWAGLALAYWFNAIRAKALTEPSI